MISIEYLRQFRVGGFALFDFVAAFIGMLVISPILSKIFEAVGVRIPKKNWVFFAVPLGIVAHMLFGTMTPLTQQFLSWDSFWLEKAGVILLCIFGLRGVEFQKRKK